MDDYITFAGGKNSACDLKSGIVTRESVLIKNPDVIVIVTMGIIGSEEKNKWSSYPELRAAKTGKIFIIDSNKACSPTPVSFVDIVEQLISMIYHT
jgi:iron complex transport system substrate-binding protein